METVVEEGSKPAVVQGTAVASPYDHHTKQDTHNEVRDPTGPGVGTKQETRCNDPIFAFLLYGNIAAIAAVVSIYGTDAFYSSIEDSSTTTDGYDYSGYIYATIVLGLFSIIFSGLTLPVMMCIPELLVKMSLFFMVGLSGAMMVMSWLYGNILGGILGTIFFAIFLCYAKAVWSRIPFASVNLLTACTAIKKNLFTVIVAYLFIALALAWSLLWAVALAGVSNKVIVESDVPFEQNQVSWGYLFLLFLSYFFTHQVIQNTLHCVVAGTVGTWWFSPADSGCGAVLGSLCRSLTTSFGSICFGSLLVAIVQATRALANAARDNENQILVCIATCILACLESILEYFNKWAFVYVGLYGYSYIEAGKQVMGLFKNRGWEAIIADDLISNVFFFLSLCVGLICAAIGYGLGVGQEQWFVNAPYNTEVGYTWIWTWSWSRTVVRQRTLQLRSWIHVLCTWLHCWIGTDEHSDEYHCQCCQYSDCMLCGRTGGI
ncbi:hypothetical protein ACHAXN_006594 [Cyclotella atomus]